LVRLATNCTYFSQALQPPRSVHDNVMETDRRIKNFHCFETLKQLYKHTDKSVFTTEEN